MTPYENRLTPLVKRMAEDMLVRNFSPSTINTYTYQVDRFQKHFNKPIEELGQEEIHQYQVHLATIKKASWSAFNQAVCGLRFLYEVTLRKPWTVKHIPFGKRPKTLPTVLGDEEVQRLLGCISFDKHRLVLLMCYAAGLRLSEATHIKLGDIDGERSMLHIRSGKGRKDRYVPISPRLLNDPTQVAKYLARYMTGGPISDSRIISHDGQEVWFQARSRDKRNESRPFRLGGRQFVLRWSQHILPKGFTKCRSYGGYHNTKRAEYLASCHQLSPVKLADEPPPELTPPPEETATEQLPRLRPHCQAEMSSSGQSNRSSWQQVLEGPYRPDWYYAFHPGHVAAMEWYRNGY